MFSGVSRATLQEHSFRWEWDENMAIFDLKSYYYSMLELWLLRRLDDGLTVAILPILRLRKAMALPCLF